MLQHPLRPTVRGSRGFQATARRATIVQATKDRVLRYPDGNVRHIRYPISESMVEDEDDVGGAWDVATYWGSSPARPQPSAAAAASCDARASNAEAAQPFSSSVRSSSEPTTPSTSGSPSPSLSDTAAYLDSLFGSSYAAAQPQIDIDHCFKVCCSCLLACMQSHASKHVVCMHVACTCAHCTLEFAVHLFEGGSVLLILCHMKAYELFLQFSMPMVLAP